MDYDVVSSRHARGSLPDEYSLQEADYYGNLLRFDPDRNVGLFPPEKA